ncbi:DUF6503 family protein [Ulvibacter antarcticus]|uniref:Threonine synthase n=1 Tax=Ulvibacter antarcticus TaxID=442714 RepID=A0A3L9YD78_9FLAO|nr:DUF6503 family protein [Ulvibacter antarcticus]RMA58611.1 hypothetical protein BXY75_1984 [Ulvibacter antarcticus]
MKSLLSVLLLSVVLISCKNEKKESEETVEVIKTVSETIQKKEYPNNIAAVFQAHGGIDTWNHMNNLCFEMEVDKGEETHSVSLKNRKAKIEAKDWTIGYDGKDVWLLNNKPDAYKGKARFYHNLMFYFYAMPFVLGDDGIIYTQLEDTELKGKSYKAVKVGYEHGIGDSPDDEYIIYLNPESNTMEWLGYTVTYGDDSKSNDWHFIKYDKWEDVNGLLLPSELIWYSTKDGKPDAKKKSRKFSKVTATETQLEPSVFAKPKDAVIVPKA